jgi:type I restriction enzyme S subunit
MTGENFWEQRKLGEVADIIGGGTPSTKNPEYWDGEIDWYSPVEIGDHMYVNESRRKITQIGLKNSSAKILPKNTVLFTSRAGIGKSAILTKEGATNQGFQSIVPRENLLDSYFIFSKTNSLKKYGERQGAGSTFVEVSGKQMEKMPLFIPSLNEQIKISNFFKYLDNYITLHQRKINILRKLKQEYLSLVFVDNENSTPMLRFKNFEIDWEEHKLGELAEIVRGASPRPIKDKKWFDQDSDIGWLRISDVTEQNGKIHYLSQKLSKEGQSKTRVLGGQHLLLSIAASVGKPVINYVKTGVHDGFLIFLNPTFNINFVFEWLEYFRPKWQRYGQPGSQVNLNSDIVRTQSLHLPSIEEQNRISKFLLVLNDYINLHQKKLDKLTKIKQSYLNKMFI